MSGGCLNDSGYSLGRCDVQETKNIQSDSFSLAYYFFSQLPRIGQNVPYFGVSVGCLKGVWEVSGGCLSDSGYCLGGMMCKQLINTRLYKSILAGSFSPCCL